MRLYLEFSLVEHPVPPCIIRKILRLNANCWDMLATLSIDPA